MEDITKLRWSSERGGCRKREVTVWGKIFHNVGRMEVARRDEGPHCSERSRGHNIMDWRPQCHGVEATL
jgi:hypothetical protein